jgi:hypothetical protein
LANNSRRVEDLEREEKEAQKGCIIKEGKWNVILLGGGSLEKQMHVSE